MPPNGVQKVTVYRGLTRGMMYNIVGIIMSAIIAVAEEGFENASLRQMQSRFWTNGCA